MQISEYAFYTLYRAEEDRLTVELERRRVALERLGEDRASEPARVTLLQRIAGRIRITGHPSLHSSR